MALENLLGNKDDSNRGKRKIKIPSNDKSKYFKTKDDANETGSQTLYNN